jgi:hypothetical protein
MTDATRKLIQLLADAQGACDEGGFNKFREKFLPNLGKSRIDELHAIGISKKSIQEIKATRLRVAMLRTKKAVPPQFRYNNGNAETDLQVVPKDHGQIDAHSIASKQTPEPTKPRSSLSPGDEALMGFSSVVSKLVQITRKEKAERFAKTSVTAGELAELGGLIIEVARLKMSGAEALVQTANGRVSKVIDGECGARSARNKRRSGGMT